MGFHNNLNHKCNLLHSPIDSMMDIRKYIAIEFYHRTINAIEHEIRAMMMMMMLTCLRSVYISLYPPSPKNIIEDNIITENSTIMLTSILICSVSLKNIGSFFKRVDDLNSPCK